MEDLSPPGTDERPCGSRDGLAAPATAALTPRLSPEEIADYHARFISCNEGFAEPKGLVRPAPYVDTPILLSHGPEKALDMLQERLREPWEKMNLVAAKKINRILADRREADAAIMLLRQELATARARCIALNEALTPSAETKAAYIGEVKFTVSTGFDEDGSEIWQDITVPWTTTKDIMAMILGHAAMSSLPPDGAERVHEQVSQPIRDEP